MKYLFFVTCFATVQVKAQATPNSSLYGSLPMCSDVPVNWYCNSAMNHAGAAPTLNVVNNNPLNTALNVCTNELVTFNYQGALCGSDNGLDMGDNCGFSYVPYMTVGGTYTTEFHIDYAYNTPGTYVVNVIGSIGNYDDPFNPYYPMCIMAKTIVNVIDCNAGSSTAACQGSFRPMAGDYVVSFWVKDDVPIGTSISYASGIEVVLTGMATGPSTIQVFASDVSNAQNTIIDGWQKVEKVITIPPDATGIEVALKSRTATADTYFDDIRIHPFNSSFKSYVYDPVTLRLAAELDERNYATFYEYDEEGQLVRVKKETERGIKTIKESRTNVSK